MVVVAAHYCLGGGAPLPWWARNTGRCNVRGSSPSFHSVITSLISSAAKSPHKPTLASFVSA